MNIVYLMGAWFVDGISGFCGFSSRFNDRGVFLLAEVGIRVVY
jgi:hypothetical protein